MIRISEENETPTMKKYVEYYSDLSKYDSEIKSLNIDTKILDEQTVKENLQKLYTKEVNEKFSYKEIENQMDKFKKENFEKKNDISFYTKQKRKCIPYFYDNCVLLNKPPELELPFYKRIMAVDENSCIPRVFGWIDKEKDFKYNIELFNADEDDRKGFIVEEFAGKPLENVYPDLSDEEILSLMVQMVDCIILLNSVGIKHQDIYPLGNIQYDTEKKKLRIIDFDKASLDTLNIEKCAKNDFKQLINCVSEMWLGKKFRVNEEIDFFDKKIRAMYAFECGESEFELDLSDLLTCYYAAINKVYVTPVMFGQELREIIAEHYPNVELPPKPKLNEEQLEYNMKCMYDINYLVND